MRLSRIEKDRIEAARSRLRQRGEFAPVKLDLEGLLGRIIGGPPNPTQREFVFSAERVALFMGPVGSAKSTSLCASVIIPALLYPGSNWFVGRLNYWTLEETTQRRFLDCLDRLGPDIIRERVTGPPFKIFIAPARGGLTGGPPEPSQIMFQSLDDMNKLGSLELTGAAIDEVNEVSEQVAVKLDERLRHRLPGQPTPDGPFFWRGVCNPVRRSHWVHRKFCGESDCDPVPWGKKFRPLRGENERNLPKGYYAKIAVGMSPEMKIRFIEGDCGPDPAGQPVFPEFRHSMHVGDLKPIAGHFFRGWDFGKRRPACVFGQVVPGGGLNRYRAELGDNELLQNFAKRMLQISQIHFPMALGWADYCDPHGNQKRDVTEETSFSVLQKMGLSPRGRDVAVETGIRLMSESLCTLTNGRPRSMYDRVGCATLIEGYAGGYCYQLPRPGVALKETPLKDGFYEHLMDADRYIEVNLSLGSALPLSAHKRTLRRR